MHSFIIAEEDMIYIMALLCPIILRSGSKQILMFSYVLVFHLMIHLYPSIPCRGLFFQHLDCHRPVVPLHPCCLYPSRPRSHRCIAAAAAAGGTFTDKVSWYRAAAVGSRSCWP
jgi:hypothetical protein